MVGNFVLSFGRSRVVNSGHDCDSPVDDWITCHDASLAASEHRHSKFVCDFHYTWSYFIAKNELSMSI